MDKRFSMGKYPANSTTRETGVTEEVEARLRESLRGLRFGSVSVVVQDGVVVQIDKIEKTRLREDRSTE